MSFFDKEVINGIHKHYVPFLVKEVMTNYDVPRILIDQQISCDIMYA